MRELNRGLCVAYLLVKTFGAQPPVHAAQVGSLCNPLAQDSLNAEQFEDARNGFLSGLEHARGSGNLIEQGACAFYLGLTSHSEALREKGGPDERKYDDLLSKTVDWYTQAHALDPSALGPIVNLAYAYVDSGRPEKADLFLRQIVNNVESDDQRSTFLSVHADILKDQKRWGEAAEHYRDALNLNKRTQPVDDQSWSSLLKILLYHFPDELAEEVWLAVEDGQQTISAHEIVLDALSRPYGLSEPARVSLLKAFVAALAQQHYDPRDFINSDMGKKLKNLRQDHQLGKAIDQIISLHDPNLLSPDNYGWWSTLDSPGKPERSRLAIFRSLIRSLAERVETSEPRVAQSYLTLGDLLRPEVSDPIIYSELAWTYAAMGDTKKAKFSFVRWEASLSNSSKQSNLNSLDPKDLANYHLKAALAIETLGLRNQAGNPLSIEYHLGEARRQGQRAREAETLLVVGAVQARNGLFPAARTTYEAIRSIVDIDRQQQHSSEDVNRLIRLRQEATDRLAVLPPGNDGK
jgi:tetratricopeptide (TPR) repeat protein